MSDLGLEFLSKLCFLYLTLAIAFGCLLDGIDQGKLMFLDLVEVKSIWMHLDLNFLSIGFVDMKPLSFSLV